MHQGFRGDIGNTTKTELLRSSPQYLSYALYTDYPSYAATRALVMLNSWQSLTLCWVLNVTEISRNRDGKYVFLIRQDHTLNINGRFLIKKYKNIPNFRLFSMDDASENNYRRKSTWPQKCKFEDMCWYAALIELLAALEKVSRKHLCVFAFIYMCVFASCPPLKHPAAAFIWERSAKWASGSSQENPCVLHLHLVRHAGKETWGVKEKKSKTHVDLSFNVVQVLIRVHPAALNSQSQRDTSQGGVFWSYRTALITH